MITDLRILLQSALYRLCVFSNLAPGGEDDLLERLSPLTICAGVTGGIAGWLGAGPYSVAAAFIGVLAAYLYVNAPKSFLLSRGLAEAVYASIISLIIWILLEILSRLFWGLVILAVIVTIVLLLQSYSRARTRGGVTWQRYWS